MLKDELFKRLKSVNTLINKAQDTISTSPVGTLKIKPQGTHVYYQHRTGNSCNGEYVKVSNVDLISKLANRSYCEKILKSASKEKYLLSRLLQFYNTVNIADIYESLNTNRKQLITPLEISDNTFSENWRKTPYTGKQLNSSYSYATEQNERVRSKSEVIIANRLHALKIPYRYEYPHTFRNITVYPDFTILDIHNRKEIIFEHFGMMDDESYRNNALNKIDLYIQNGFIPGVSFICTFESKSHPLNIEVLDKILRQFKP